MVITFEEIISGSRKVLSHEAQSAVNICTTLNIERTNRCRAPGIFAEATARTREVQSTGDNCCRNKFIER